MAFRLTHILYAECEALSLTGDTLLVPGIRHAVGRNEGPHAQNERVEETHACEKSQQDAVGELDNLKVLGLRGWTQTDAL